MTKQELIDIAVVFASIVGPIAALLSALFAAKSSKAAKIAADLNLKMYEEQIQEKENQKEQKYQTEYQKLLTSLYNLPQFIRKHYKDGFTDIYAERRQLEEAHDSLGKVDISVFNGDELSMILHVKKDLRYRLDEVKGQRINQYDELMALSSLVDDLLKLLREKNS